MTLHKTSFKRLKKLTVLSVMLSVFVLMSVVINNGEHVYGSV
jgi:hypothetical protein